MASYRPRQFVVARVATTHVLLLSLWQGRSSLPHETYQMLTQSGDVTTPITTKFARVWDGNNIN